MRFDDCLKIVLAFEGGYSENANDHGGATNYGITQRTYDLHRVNLNLPQQPVKYITLEEAKAIYQRSYWNAVRASTLPTPLDLVMFDTAVNCGPKQAIKFLQRALGIDDDGAMGQQTAKALNEEAIAGDLNDTWKNVLAQREDFYKELAKKPGQHIFLKGWINRVAALRKACGE